MIRKMEKGEEYQCILQIGIMLNTDKLELCISSDLDDEGKLKVVTAAAIGLAGHEVNREILQHIYDLVVFKIPDTIVN
jgi:hypothetical protein